MRLRRRRPVVRLRRRRPVVVDPVDAMRDVVRSRLHRQFDAVLADPGTVASLDQLATALRHRFVECGVDLAEPAARAALLVVVDTFTASLAPWSPVCTTSVRMMAIAAQITGAVLSIDSHERGVRP